MGDHDRIRRHILEDVQLVGSTPPPVRSMPSLVSSFLSAPSDPSMGTPVGRIHPKSRHRKHGTWGIRIVVNVNHDDPCAMHARMVSMPSAWAALRFLHISRTSGMSRCGIEG